MPDLERPGQSTNKWPRMSHICIGQRLPPRWKADAASAVSRLCRLFVRESPPSPLGAPAFVAELGLEGLAGGLVLPPTFFAARKFLRTARLPGFRWRNGGNGAGHQRAHAPQAPWRLSAIQLRDHGM